MMRRSLLVVSVTWSSEIIINMLHKKHFWLLSILKILIFLLKLMHLIFQDSQMNRKLNLFNIIFNNAINVFTVTFNQLNASLIKNNDIISDHRLLKGRTLHVIYPIMQCTQAALQTNRKR